MNAEHLLTHFDRLADAPDAIPRLRRFILDLAVRGKLVEQNPEDEPTEELLKRIAAEKKRLMEVGKVRKKSSALSGQPVELDFQIPVTWISVRLAEISNIVMGQSPPGHTYNTYGEGAPLINGPVEFSEGPFGMTVVNQYTTAPTNFCDKGDFLICVRGSTTGRSNIAAFKACIGRGVAAIQPLFDDGFIRFFLWRMRERIISMGRGIAFPSISRKQLENLSIPLPPLAEQHRIVAKVDELMALCDRLETSRKERETTRDRLATASLTRLNAPAPDPAVFQNYATFALNNLTPLTTRPDQIKALRQTILNLAVRGKLVEQDPSDEPVVELLKRIAVEKVKLTKKRKLRAQRPLPPLSDSDVSLAIPAGWQWVRLGDVIKLWSGFAFKSEDFQLRGIPVIRIGDLQAGKVDLSNTVCISEDIASSIGQEFWIPPHALLIAMSGATTGKVAFNKTGKKLLLNQRVGRIEAFLIDVNFVRFFFDTIVARNLEISFGTAIPNLSAKQINETIIPLPPLAEQHRIVAKVDELMALCDRLEARLTAGEEARGRLMNALLHEM